MMERQSFEKFLTSVRQLNQNLTTIIGGAQATEMAAFDQAVDQFDGAVMVQLHALSQNADGRFKIGGELARGAPELVLLRAHTGPAGGRLTQAHNTPKAGSGMRR